MPVKPQDATETKVWVAPETRTMITIGPYLPIENNEDGTGGGIRCRLHDGSYVDIVWGERTEIQVCLET